MKITEAKARLLIISSRWITYGLVLTSFVMHKLTIATAVHYSERTSSGIGSVHLGGGYSTDGPWHTLVYVFAGLALFLVIGRVIFRMIVDNDELLVSDTYPYSFIEKAIRKWLST